jgi:hypothetical protein
VAHTRGHAAAEKQEDGPPVTWPRRLRLAELVEQLRHRAELALRPQERCRRVLEIRLHARGTLLNGAAHSTTGYIAQLLCASSRQAAQLSAYCTTG